MEQGQVEDEQRILVGAVGSGEVFLSGEEQEHENLSERRN